MKQHGYYTTSSYIVNYYAEFNPVHVELFSLIHGLERPPSRSFVDMGCGMGLNTILTGIANPSIKCTGVDLMSSHIQWAKDLLVNRFSGTPPPNIQFHCASVEDLSLIEHQETYDLIAFHGFFSWVPKESLNAALNFVKTKLHQDGIVYTGLNVDGIYSHFEPWRKLALAFQREDGSVQRSPQQRIVELTEYLESLMSVASETRIPFSNTLEAFVQLLKNKDPEYLCHELLNEDWRNLSFVEWAQMFHQRSNLRFIGTAAPSKLYPQLSLLPAAQSFLARQSGGEAGTQLENILTGTTFRNDLWSMKKAHLDRSERLKRIGYFKVLLMCSSEDVSLNYKTGNLSINLDPKVYHPILQRLEQCSWTTIAELMQLNSSEPLLILQAILILYSRGHLALSPPQPPQAKARQQCHQFNYCEMERSLSGENIGFMVSPATGGGIQWSRANSTFLCLFMKGRTQAQTLSAAYFEHNPETTIEQTKEMTHRFLTKSLRLVRELDLCDLST